MYIAVKQRSREKQDKQDQNKEKDRKRKRDSYVKVRKLVLPSFLLS